MSKISFEIIPFTLIKTPLFHSETWNKIVFGLKSTSGGGIQDLDTR